MEIKVDDLTEPEIARFLEEHIEEMKSVSPPESKHALDVESLKDPDITFWTVWDNRELVGCGALKRLDSAHAEIKSMRTSAGARGKGIASMLLTHMLDAARSRGHRRASLETGSMAYFERARRLYLKHGFEYCAPFAEYKKDPNSVFMTREL
jgi:putative acetyltransferase